MAVAKVVAFVRDSPPSDSGRRAKNTVADLRPSLAGQAFGGPAVDPSVAVRPPEDERKAGELADRRFGGRDVARFLSERICGRHPGEPGGRYRHLETASCSSASAVPAARATCEQLFEHHVAAAEQHHLPQAFVEVGRGRSACDAGVL